MECYAIGDAIRDARRRHGLTQEELAFGICSVSTLSKIENGRRVPRCRTFEALMQRMGEAESPYVIYTGRWDVGRGRLIREMEQAIRMRDLPRLAGQLRLYCELPGGDRLDQQWKLLAETVLLFAADAEWTAIYEKLEAVVRMTHPRFTCDSVRPGRYTRCELLAMQLLAFCHQKTGDFAKARSILEELLRHFGRSCSGADWRKDAEASLCYQMAEIYCAEGQHASSAGFCARGIRICLLGERYHFLASLLAQWACIMAELGNTKESHMAKYHAILLSEIRTNQKYLSKFL